MTTRRYLSVELEISGTADGETTATDRCCSRHGIESVGDGSLSGGNPFELNTPPARGDAFAEMVDDVSAALTSDGSRINTSCGFHVHVDARDYDHHAVGRLVQVYAAIEDALFAVVAPSRQKNQYAQRCGPKFLARIEVCGSDWSNSDSVIARTVYGTYDRSEVKRAKKKKYRDERYTALNLHSWVYRGTIECRLHQGTFDARKIRNWAHLWGAIVDYAKDHESISLPSDSWDALMAIAPTDEVRDWLRSRREKFARTTLDTEND